MQLFEIEKSIRSRKKKSNDEINHFKQFHSVCSNEVTPEDLNSMRGIDNTDRIDEALYQDFETEANKKVRCA